MNSYQPIYDAVRSRISGANISDAVSEAIRGAGIDHAATMIQRSWQDAAQEAMDAARQHSRPSAVYRPRIFPDGKSWCALLGPDIASGVVGFGGSPELACQDFDAAWIKKTAPAQPRGEEKP